MPRQINLLTAKSLAAKTPSAANKTAGKETRYPDGQGLYLSVKPSGARSWVFVYRWGDKRQEMGLGPATGPNALSEGRTAAEEARGLLKRGVNPIKARREAKAAAKAATVPPPEVMTFGKFADALVADIEGGFRNAKHRQQWRNTLSTHAARLRSMPIAEVDTAAVLAVLKPIWTFTPETAARLRGRIERVLDAAAAMGHRDPERANPARWRGHLALLLPRQSKAVRGHHAALPWQEVGAFMAELRNRPAVSARCLEFTILTAARSGESMGARWCEFSDDLTVWTVPGARIKAGREHRVPLPAAATELLKMLRPKDAAPEHYVFHRGNPDQPLSNMALEMLLRRMGRTEITVHGFRSTFRDWAGETESTPVDVVEMALAHVVGSSTERAYRRGDAFEKRRALMERWADFCARPSGGNVSPFRRAG